MCLCSGDVDLCEGYDVCFDCDDLDVDQPEIVTVYALEEYL